MDYTPLSASGGSASSTLSGKDSAVAVFKVFLSSMNEDYDTADESICQISLFQKFATFLMTYVSKVTKSEISLGTMLQYLSGAKETLQKRFPNASMWSDGDYKFSTNNSWYKKINYYIVIKYFH